MTKDDATRTLLQYNAWRRYGGPIGEGPDMPDPTEVGKAIDFAVSYMSDKKPEREYYGG